MTEFSWVVADMERQLSDGCICTVHYRVNATNGGAVAGAYGSISLERGDDFVPYPDVTEAMVVSWVQEKLGGAEKVTEIQAALQAQIDEQLTPSSAKGVPWS